MKTSIFEDEGGVRWVVNHNSDWSGTVYLKPAGDAPWPVSLVRDGMGHPDRQAIPGEVVRQAAARILEDSLVELAEQGDLAEILQACKRRAGV